MEENPETRQNVNIYKDSRKVIPVDSNDLALDPSIPQITLEEMMDDLVIVEDSDMTECYE